MKGYLFLIIVSLLCSNALVAQNDTLAPVNSGGDSSRVLRIIRSARLNIEKIDSVTTLQSLAGNVLVRQGGTLFSSDSAVINQFTTVMQAYGNIDINDNDSLHTYARYLRYVGRERKAFLKEKVKLVDSKGSVLTTNELDYDLNTQIAIYSKGGTVVNKKTVLTSKEGEYNGATKDVLFKKNVVLKDPEYSIYTDSLLYNTQTEIATFIAPTTIVNKGRIIYTKDGYYDLKQGKAFFAKRPRIVDSTFSVIAEEMAFDDKEGLGQFRGNVVYVDTVNHVSVISNLLFVNNKQSSFLATEKPLMIIAQDGDSTYITADTLFSGKISNMDTNRIIPVLKDTSDGYKLPDLTGKDSSMNRFFEAWNHVRIFSDSAQSVCDSMFYAGTDSIFRLFREPVLWSGDSQISADTIYLFTKNKKSDRLEAFFNGFIINKVGSNQFNQIKGKTVNALFKEGSIDFARAKGRSETIYFALDEEEKFIGMNRSSSDAVEMYFVERKVKRIKFINDLKGTTYPMRQIPPGEDRMEGFIWHESRRPKTKFDLFGQ